MRWLGLDMGQRRIGVALSDPLGLVASPLKAIERQGQEVAEIKKLVEEYKVEGVVVGLPRSLSGALGVEAQAVLGFCEELARSLPVPVKTWEEQFSTVAAEKLLREAGVKREKRRLKVDALAASLILSGFLERIRSEAS